MSNNLSEPIKQRVKQQASSSLYQPKKRNILQPKFLLIISGIVLVILSIVGVFLVAMKNRNKSREIENLKKAEISQEKITSVPTGIESTWNGKKTVLYQGEISGFDEKTTELVITLPDGSEKIVGLEPDAIYFYVDFGKTNFGKQTDISPSKFWMELRKGDYINTSCYEESGRAIVVTKRINYAGE